VLATLDLHRLLWAAGSRITAVLAPVWSLVRILGERVAL